jgi:hypothetical protein
LAFTLPPRWLPGTGLSIVATHVDSPNLKVIDHTLRCCRLIPHHPSIVIDTSHLQTHQVWISPAWH